MANLQIEQYWKAYLATLPDDVAADKMYIIDQFGDFPQLIDELTTLVVAGTKTATCSALWEWEAEGSDLPKVGTKSIVLDSNHQPVCILETTEITIRPFNEVDAQFAYDEGEDDRSLESWRREHWKYFSRVLPKINKVPTLEMPLVCERFQVIHS
jgi:uncharacterized protein YhfF